MWDLDKINEVVTHGLLEPLVIMLLVAAVLGFAKWQGWL